MHQEFLTKNTKYKKNQIRKNKKGRGILLMFTLLALLFVSLILIDISKNWVGSRMVKLAEMKESVLFSTVSLTGYILKDEILFYAQAAGHLEAVAQEGQRIGAGGTVAKITGGYDSKFENRTAQLITAPAAGIVSYEIDGLENILNINNYQEIEFIRLPEFAKFQSLLVDRVEAGQPVGKIINNLKPVGIMVFFESEEVQDMVQQAVQQSKQALFKLGDGSLELVPAQLLKANTGESRGMMIFETKGSYQELFHLREINLELVLEHYRGLVVNERSLVYEYDEPGLITIGRNNTYQWLPVEITGKIGDELVITGLDKGAVYITNPR